MDSARFTLNKTYEKTSSDGPDVSAPDLDMVVFRIYFKAVAQNI